MILGKDEGSLELGNEENRCRIGEVEEDSNQVWVEDSLIDDGEADDMEN